MLKCNFRSGINQTLKLNSQVISMLLCVPVKKTLEGHVTIVMKHLKVSIGYCSTAKSFVKYCRVFPFPV